MREIEPMEVAFAWIWLWIQLKKGKINTQADTLSTLNTMGETFRHDGNDDIPIFELKRVKVELEINK